MTNKTYNLTLRFTHRGESEEHRWDNVARYEIHTDQFGYKQIRVTTQDGFQSFYENEGYKLINFMKKFN